MNPDALTDCEFCGIQSSDQFLGLSFNMFYDNRWRDIGALVGFIGFNVSCLSTVALLRPPTD
jgi:ATP-binding cassette subfamily G (WHITE) protein 2 (SNQ2)